MAQKNKLTPKQTLFVEKYIETNYNGAKAARDAGYSPKTAKNQASRLLTKVNIQEAVAKRRDKLFKEISEDQLSTLKGIRCCAHVDIRKLFHKDGSLKHVHELDDDTASAVQSIEVTKRKNPLFDKKKDNPADEFMEVVKIKLTDKKGFYEMLARHQGMFPKEAVDINLPDIPGVIIFPGERKHGEPVEYEPKGKDEA